MEASLNSADLFFVHTLLIECAFSRYTNAADFSSSQGKLDMRPNSFEDATGSIMRIGRYRVF